MINILKLLNKLDIFYVFFYLGPPALLFLQLGGGTLLLYDAYILLTVVPEISEWLGLCSISETSEI